MLLDPGTKAPDFTLPDAYGNLVSLKEFRGRRVILWFFPKANTPGWTIEGQGFRDEFQEFEQRDIQIIGISADPPDKQRKFVEKQGFNYPMLCDESHEMLTAYGVWGPKKFMGREYEGTSRVTYLVNEDGTVYKVYPKVKPAGHAQEILADWT
jgi:peroxiredoxin Q/BCP